MKNLLKKSNQKMMKNHRKIKNYNKKNNLALIMAKKVKSRSLIIKKMITNGVGLIKMKIMRNQKMSRMNKNGDGLRNPRMKKSIMRKSLKFKRIKNLMIKKNKKFSQSLLKILRQTILANLRKKMQNLTMNNLKNQRFSWKQMRMKKRIRLRKKTGHGEKEMMSL